jgi:hypothetical protein
MRKGFEVMPSNENRKKFESELIQNNILLSPVKVENKEFY